MISSAAYQPFADTIATYSTEHDVGLALHQLAVTTVGARLFTMTADNPTGGYVRRVYSSNETACPVLGIKPLVSMRRTAG